ncbi:MAG: hypothetical protein RDV48_13070 [Candidatus Eremiobacteraeota bacterium]|nr:hypothetical protein [Candidatus Eremiobacteraeota bacterium]
MRRAPRFLAALLLAFHLFSCTPGGTGGISPPPPAATSSPVLSTGSPGARPTESPGKVGEHWKEVLASRLKTAPGLVYCSAGDASPLVKVIEGKEHKVKEKWPSETIKYHLALRPDGTELWCTPPYWEFGKGLLRLPLMVMNPKNGAIMEKIPCPGAVMTAFTPDSEKAYVSLIASSTVEVYDVKTRKKTGAIDAGKHPKSLCVSFDGRRLYVGHSSAVTADTVTTPQGIKLPRVDTGSEYVTVIDTASDKVTEKIAVKGIPAGLALKPDGSLLYASVNNVVRKPYTALTKGPVAVIDTAGGKIIRTITYPGTHPISDLAYTPDGKKVYGICGGLQDSAFVFDAEKHVLKKVIALDVGG